ncbi:MAG: transporter large permease [Myxococcaceae bacterium]|nr:transporter large permease [Myxococcaceae bacterium]
MTLALVLAFLAITAIGVPLFLLFGASSMVLFAASEGTITSVAMDVFSEKFADSPTLVTIPLFTIAGYLMAEGGTPRRLITLSRALLGWMPGGLAIVCLCTSAFFTTFTGGSGITIVAIGGLLMPALLQEGYPKRFSLGLITSAGSLGIMFPPALPLILYGIVANVLLDKLFLAGLIPGLLTVFALCGYAMFVGDRAKVEKVPFEAKKALAAIWESKWELGLPIVIIGGMATGLLRVHEASAFTGLYVLLIEAFVYREISLSRDLPRIIRESMTLVGAILAILSTAIGFTGYLIQAQVPMKLLAAMQVLITSKFMFLLVLNVFLLIAGMVMEIFAAIFVVVPLIVPIATHFGVDPYHLGITFLVNLEIAYLAPPLGLNLIIASFRFEKPVTEVYRAVLPFIGVLAITLLITTYVPWLSTFLPSLSKTQDLNSAQPLPAVDEAVPDAEGNGGGNLDDLDDLDQPAETLDDLDSLNLDELDKLDKPEAQPSVLDPGAPMPGEATGEVRDAPPAPVLPAPAVAPAPTDAPPSAAQPER